MWQIVLYVNTLSVSLFVLIAALVSVLLTRWIASAPAERRRIARILFVTSLVVVLLATIAPTQLPGSGTRYVSLSPGGAFFGSEIEGMYPMERRMATATSIANAAMFVPLAIFRYAAVKRSSGLQVLAESLALSVCIELVQLIMNAGRVVDIDDVLFNTTGALIGVLVAGASARWVGKGPRSGRHRADAPESAAGRRR
ncbi:VanZ family protein [Streptomyces sp. NPDC005389]|uniref:VanZ family protein n=1 Tax=Streptomyces sp. NPDC005389 TaxID=3157040 RepID=UPI00339E1CF9